MGRESLAEEPVFYSAGTGVKLKEIGKAFRRACELAGIPYGQNTPRASPSTTS